MQDQSVVSQSPSQNSRVTSRYHFQEATETAASPSAINAPIDSCAESIRQPITRAISHDQLVIEVKGIYAGLVLLEAKAIEVDEPQLQPWIDRSSEHQLSNDRPCEPRAPIQPSSVQLSNDRPSEPRAPIQPSSVQRWENSSDVETARHPMLSADKYRSLIALRKQLLHEHHDFFLASQHPAASKNLSGLASKYAMAGRMWKHGVSRFLEVLRIRLPDASEHMLAFIYISYHVLTPLYETVPVFEDTWIECLGDLRRYRVTVERTPSRDRYWSNIARYWYVKALVKNQGQGRLFHHIAVLAREYSNEQISLFSRALIAVEPFVNARLPPTATLYQPILGGTFNGNLQVTQQTPKLLVEFQRQAAIEKWQIGRELVFFMICCISGALDSGALDSNYTPRSIIRRHLDRSRHDTLPQNAEENLPQDGHHVRLPSSRSYTLVPHDGGDAEASIRRTTRNCQMIAEVFNYAISEEHWMERSDKGPERNQGQGRFFYHLAILAKEDFEKQQSLFFRALITEEPYINARLPLMATLYQPILKTGFNFDLHQHVAQQRLGALQEFQNLGTNIQSIDEQDDSLAQDPRESLPYYSLPSFQEDNDECAIRTSRVHSLVKKVVGLLGTVVYGFHLPSRLLLATTLMPRLTFAAPISHQETPTTSGDVDFRWESLFYIPPSLGIICAVIILAKRTDERVFVYEVMTCGTATLLTIVSQGNDTPPSLTLMLLVLWAHFLFQNFVHSCREMELSPKVFLCVFPIGTLIDLLIMQSFAANGASTALRDFALLFPPAYSMALAMVTHGTQILRAFFSRTD